MIELLSLLYASFEYFQQLGWVRAAGSSQPYSAQLAQRLLPLSFESFSHG